MKYFATVEGTGRTHELAVEDGPPLRVRLADGRVLAVDYAEVGPSEVSLLIEGRSFALAISRANGSRGAFVVADPRAAFRVTVADERERLRSEAAPFLGKRGAAGGGPHDSAVRSVMPGIVTRVMVKVGDRVEAGSPLLHLEAMKMENEIRSPSAGVIAKLHARPGQTVSTGDLLVELSPPI